MTLLTDLGLLERLVAFDTTSSKSNLELAQFVADYLDRPGVQIDRNPSADGAKVNLVVRIGPELDVERNGLLLSGHMDVVPALEEGWRSDPFCLTERDDTLVARGSSDMKGFLALAVNAFARLKVDQLQQPLALLFTYDEELGTLGSRHFVETWPEKDPLPRRTVVGEPTSLTLLRAHKGHLTYRARFAGKAAHSGFPHLGKNALEPLARALLALTELDRELQSERPEHSDFFPSVPFAPLNVGRAQGGVAVNVVPDSSAIEFGVRHLPGMQPEGIEQRIRHALDGALRGEHYELELERESPPMMAPVGCGFHQTLQEVTGCSEGEGASFATDAGWFQVLGHECVLLGPGSIEVAHRPNEFVPRADLNRGAHMVQQLIRRFCL